MIPAGSPVLLDTSIVIHLARGGTASERLESRFGLLSRPLTPWISAVTVGELLAFALRNGWGPRKLDALKQLIANLVVVNINREQVLQAYAVLDTHLKQSGISHRPERSVDRGHRCFHGGRSAHRGSRF